MIEIFLIGDIIEGRNGVTWEIIKRRKSPSGKHTYRLKCQKCGFITRAGTTGIQRKFLSCPKCNEIDYSKNAVCRKCGRELPRTSFRERVNCVGGINHTCKECEIKFCKDPEYLADWENNTKICKRCGETKTPADFYEYPSSADGLTYWCKACSLEHRWEYIERKRLEKEATKPLVEETVQERLSREERREIREKEKEIEKIEFERAREEFFSNPSNEGKKFLISKWRRGEYNYFK